MFLYLKISLQLTLYKLKLYKESLNSASFSLDSDNMIINNINYI